MIQPLDHQISKLMSSHFLGDGPGSATDRDRVGPQGSVVGGEARLEMGFKLVWEGRFLWAPMGLLPPPPPPRGP